MRRTLSKLILVLVVGLTYATAQTARPIKTTVCEVSAHPRKLDGRIVTLRAKVISGFEVFAIEDPAKNCERMWLEYAGGGPSASVSIGGRSPKPKRTAIDLHQDAEFEKFENLLSSEMHPRDRGTVCMGGCKRYEVTATMTGRVDVAPKDTGFGHLNGFKLQFELESVSDVVATDLADTYDSALFSPTPVRFPTAYFVGRVRSPSGKAAKGVEVTATRTDSVPLYLRTVTKWTDDDGRFQLDVPPEAYVLGINTVMPIRPQHPYPPTYFPGTTDRTSAKVLTVADGERVDTDIPIPTSAARHDIAVRIEWPDGKPAAGVTVWVSELRTPHWVAGDGIVSHADQNGSLTLPAFEDVAYTVHAETNVLHPKSYEHFCAQPERIGNPLTAPNPVLLKLSIKGEEVCRDLNR